MNAALLAFATLLSAGPQDASDSRPANDPKAVELFRKAAEAQLPGQRAVVIRDFQADLEVTIHERNEKTGEVAQRSATVVQFYRDRGEKRPLFRRHLIEKFGGTTTVQGFDGDVFWQQLGDTAARDLRGRESKDERERVVTEMNRTREFLWFLFLANLEGKDVVLRHGGKRTIEANGIKRDTEIVVREKPGEAPIELFIGEADGRPVLFGLSRRTAAGRTEMVAFSVHRVVRGPDHAVLVPLVAQYREDGRLTFEARASKETDIKINTRIDDRVFALPR
jgi:hypothetical protein